MNDFPIRTSTGCQLKWAWSTIYLNRQTTSSCHRVNQIKLNPDNFKNFHNLPEKINDRKLMLNGERPGNGCEYCFKIEDAGGFSDRQNHIGVAGITPQELLENNSETIVTPTILEIYFNNTCNLNCLYCGPHFSSVWEKEFKKYGNVTNKKNELITNHKLKNFNDYGELTIKLWEWMRENSKHLKRFHILGGEPFYQKEFLDCLDHFENYPNPQCEFVIITNLMVDDTRMDYYIERFKKLISKRKLKGLQITCSLDCWGPQAEFIRTGLDLAQWQRNFEKLLQIKWIRLQINHAVNVLSIKYMHELVDKIIEWNKVKKIYTQYMTVMQPECMNPDIFGGNLYKKDLEAIIKKLPNDTTFESSIREYFIGISKQIGVAQPNVTQIENLKIYLEEIDLRRNTNYKEYFPWLEEAFKIILDKTA
jgi:organic radical activating enzyme